MSIKTEELLKEAAERYPPGTSYLSVATEFSDYDMHTVSRPVPEIFDLAPTRVMLEKGTGLVYNDGVWAPVVHRDYCQFSEGDRVVRWRDIEDWEWESIGEVPTPKIGEPITIDAVEGPMGLSKVAAIADKESQCWFPATAFVLERDYYKPNRGTAELNTTDYGKESRIIKVQRSVASIVTGERRTGSRVQGRGNAAVVGGGYSSHKACFGS